ncbi:ABC transporter permease [Pseudoclavibacter endophyticus]|nr:ABC transporter permease [Pseudoclavibacter endophyticus]
MAAQERPARRSWIMRRPGIAIGIALLVALALFAVLVPLLSPYDANDATAVQQRMQAPSAEHPFGTDDFGRDVMLRLAVGIGTSMQVALGTSIVALVLGLFLGLVAVFVRLLDQPIMRVCDGLLAIPGVLLALAVVAATGASTWSLIACLIIVETPNVVRLTRSAALGIRERRYVEAAEAAGVRPATVVVRHVLPGVVVPVAVQASAVFGAAIIIEAALSFLGAGVPAPTASLGNMLSDAKGFINIAWWMMTFPAAALAGLVLGANLIGDGIAGSGLLRRPRRRDRARLTRDEAMSIEGARS